MVVCKKGVKAHPDRPDPHVLLARVYADQGKDRKALEEVEAALGASANDVPALRLGAGILLKTGENDKGRDYAVRAHTAAPTDPETKELLDKWKIEVAPPPPPPAPPAPMAEVMTNPGVPSGGLPPGYPMQVTQSNGSPVMNGHPSSAGGRGANGQAVGQNGYSDGPPPVAFMDSGGMGEPTAPAEMPRARKAPRSKLPDAGSPRDRSLGKFDEPEVQARKSGEGEASSSGSSLLAVVVLAGFFFWSRQVKLNRAAMSEALHECGEDLRNDSYASYKKATESAEKVLKNDPDSIAGHAYLAYIYAIRWGEHGEGDSAKSQALDQLAKAEKLHLEHSHLLAAQALIQFFNGGTRSRPRAISKRR